MKKLVVALTAIAAFTAPALAADMAATRLRQGARAGCLRAVQLDRLLDLRRRLGYGMCARTSTRYQSTAAPRST